MDLLGGAAIIVAIGITLGILLHGFPNITIHKHYKNNRE